MRIGFLVNDIDTEKAGFTTQRLAITAVNRGHEVWFLGAGDLAYDVDEKIHAWARTTEAHQRGLTAEQAAETVDMTDHGEHYNVPGPGVPLAAVQRVYALLEGR